MLEITPISTIIYAITFAGAYYLIISLLAKRFLSIEPLRLLFYVSLFCVFGVAGEVLVNSVWEAVFGSPLWEYRIYPMHGGDVSYFFPFVWGLLGFYKYLNDTFVHSKASRSPLLPGVIMGVEAMFLEIAFNGLFLLLFSQYIFYYFPDNVGPLSHLTCLEVIPFYFIVGITTSYLIRQQDLLGYSRKTLIQVSFYIMILTAIFIS